MRISLRKVASLFKQFGPVSTCLCPKYIKFFFQNLRNDREDENGYRLHLVLRMGEKFSKYFLKLNFFSFWKPNVVYLQYILSFLTSLQFSKFWKQNIENFRHKHVEIIYLFN